MMRAIAKAVLIRIGQEIVKAIRKGKLFGRKLERGKRRHTRGNSFGVRKRRRNDRDARVNPSKPNGKREVS